MEEIANHLLHSFLIDKGIEQPVTGPCLYKKCIIGNIVLIIFCVDDILVSSYNQRVLNDVKSVLSQGFKMKDLGEIKWLLGIEFNSEGDRIVMSPKSYYEKVIRKFGFENYNSRKSPYNNGLNQAENGSQKIDNTELYREIVGSFIYAMTATRPDLS